MISLRDTVHCDRESLLWWNHEWIICEALEALVKQSRIRERERQRELAQGVWSQPIYVCQLGSMSRAFYNLPKQRHHKEGEFAPAGWYPCLHKMLGFPALWSCSCHIHWNVSTQDTCLRDSTQSIELPLSTFTDDNDINNLPRRTAQGLPRALSGCIKEAWNMRLGI